MAMRKYAAGVTVTFNGRKVKMAEHIVPSNMILSLVTYMYVYKLYVKTLPLPGSSRLAYCFMQYMCCLYSGSSSWAPARA